MQGHGFGYFLDPCIYEVKSHGFGYFLTLVYNNLTLVYKKYKVTDLATFLTLVYKNLTLVYKK